MNASLSSFIKLCNSIREKTARDLEQKRPDNQLAKWRKLLTAVLETELAMHRVRSALNLLKTLPSKETLNMFFMSEGAWIDYQYGTWSFWMCSLLDKEIELVSQVSQQLIKPSNPQYREIERPLSKSLVSQKNKVGKIRHPLAHKGKGGTIEAVMREDSWKGFVVIPSPVDFNCILASCVPYHMRWHHFLHQVSIVILVEIERISAELNQQIDWDNI